MKTIRLFVMTIIMCPLAVLAQTDSLSIARFNDQFPKLQPLKVDMSNILPDKKKMSVTSSPLFHADDWQMMSVPTFKYQNADVEMRRAMMMPYYWTPSILDDVRVQPLFKFKAGKNTFHFGIGINMDAVRHGIDMQRMLTTKTIWTGTTICRMNHILTTTSASTALSA